MFVSALLTMFDVLVLWPVLLVTAAQTLTIDSQLGTSIEDCFERVTIGEQLPSNAIYRNVTELTIRECENLCKQDKKCQSFDYGVGAKGNATCELSTVSEKEIREEKLLKRNPDYDVYIRRFQCEQSPPSPLHPEFDDPGPAHRPVFKPDPADKPDYNLPLSDEPYQRPEDLRPHNTYRPSLYDAYRPSPYNHHTSYNRPYKRPYHSTPDYYNNNHIDYERPDHYTNAKPEFDTPLGYGPHRPQDAPFRPEKPYRPQQNQSHSKPKPDPYDILHFQEQYYNPTKPSRPQQDSGYWRPDPHYPPSPADEIQDIYGQKPSRPHPVKPNDYPEKPYPVEEKPLYEYFVRPNRRPIYNTQIQKPVDDDSGYGQKPSPSKPIHDNPRPDPGYGIQSDHGHLGGPVGPPDYYRPEKPNHYPPRPSDHYHGQYASNYGQNSNYNQDNYIYVEIHDPPIKPYKPTKPQHYQNSGYGSQSYGESSSSQNSYSQSNLNEQLSHFGDQYGQNYNRPHDYHKPTRPGYGTISDITHSLSYGSQSNANQHYSQSDVSYGSSHKPSSSTNRPQSDSYFGGQRPLDDNYRPDSYGGGNKPSYDSNNHGSQGAYGHNQGSYGSSQGSYGSNQELYGNTQSSHGGHGTSNSNDQSSYGSNQGSYGSSQGTYGSNKPLYDSGNQGSYVSNQGAYGSGTGSYGSSQGSYGGNSEAYGSNSGSYSQGLYGGSGGSYQNDQGSYGQSSSYGGDDYKNNQNKPSYGKPQSNTSHVTPAIKPVYEYELDRPHGVPSYIVKPDGEVVSSKPVAVSDYANKRPGLSRDPQHEVSYRMCFRRVLAGRRALRSHVRRALACETLEDCRRECAIERRFHCESFNYRLDPSFRGKGLCEMMTKPIEAFDLRRDFVDDKDYDFYELDRNSLEPNCPSTLRGPGLLHSGYLNSKGNGRPGYQEQWADRYDDWGYQGPPSIRPKDPYDRRFYDDRRDVNRFYGTRRRYEDRFFVPYQIGQVGLGRSNEQQEESWGQYGGMYGGFDNYYKNRNDYKNSLSHWKINDERFERPDHFYGVKPYGSRNEFNYQDLGRRKSGSWDNYGSGYGSWRRGWNDSGSSSNWSGLSYGESNYYGSRKDVGSFYYEHQNEPPVKDCSSRKRPGMSLGSGAIRRSLLARTVVECEAACFNEREFKCVSYSYRYSKSHGTDNCFLSERPYQGLDMASDSGSDVYAMPQDQHCSTVNHKPWVESECFWHVRSGAAVSGSAVKSALTVAGLGACEAECIRAHGFFCRGFSFRFDSPTIGDDVENCLLTSSPPTTLEPGRALRATPGHELYARGNYGRGCEPALYDETAHREKQCYLQYDNAARLIGAAVRGQARVQDEQACGTACTNAPFRCLSFSFNNNAPPSLDNCLLSEIRLFDLQRGVDYEHSTDDWLFAFDLFNGQCWRKARPGDRDGDAVPELPRPIPPQSDLTPQGPYPPAVVPPSGPYIPSGPSPSGPGYLPNRPDYIPVSGPPSGSGYPRPGYKPSFIPAGSFRPSGPPGPYVPGSSGLPGPYRPSGPSGSSGSYRPSGPSGLSGPYRPGPSGGFAPGYLPEPSDGKGHDALDRPTGEVSWRHYTVSGLPCRAGSACAASAVAAHWACEPEGGEVGAWDYCCAPAHRCGYSEGFHKPWCYVGPEPDQWRPCSEKYYPYHQHTVPHPSQGHREERPRPRPGYEHGAWPRPGGATPDSYLPIGEDRRKPAFIGAPYLPEADRKYWDDLYKNGPSAYYDSNGNPLPGYVRVPTSGRPHIKYQHNYGPRPGASSHWAPVSALDSEESLDPPVPGGLGVPRYWPVAYLHKEPPPNTTYFRFNETNPINNINRQPPSTTERQQDPNRHRAPPVDRPAEFNPPVQARSNNNFIDDNNNKNNHRDEKTRNITGVDKDVFKTDEVASTKGSTTTEANTPLPLDIKPAVKENISAVDSIKTDAQDPPTEPKGIDGKIDDFSSPIEVLDIEDAKTKGEKLSDIRTLEAEERQIEEIGRLLASRRGGKLVLEKRSQKDLEAKNIAIDKELADEFNFGSRFPAANIERRGIIQKVTKDEIQSDLKGDDKSLEVSETTYVRPPRVLSTTAPSADTIRKAYVNGKVFYDATIREQRDLYVPSNLNATARKQKSLLFLKTSEDSRLNPLTHSYGKKKIKPRNVNPVRRTRRIYRKRYNPEEVRKRLLERERSLRDASTNRKM